MKNYLVESALLTHGLASIPDSRLISSWEDGWGIAWMSCGKLKTGDVEEFCRFRDEAAGLTRINYFNYRESEQKGASGPLTASGTIRACLDTGARLVVTCGLGGLNPGEPPEHSNDIKAMREQIIEYAARCPRGGGHPVSVIATAFKDMFDADVSIDAAVSAGMQVRKLTGHWHTGYVFSRGRELTVNVEFSRDYTPATLYFAPVPPESLISDRTILEDAVSYGTEMAEKGEAFHPAVNRRIDELTAGYSSELQLDSLIANIKFAEDMFAGKAK